MVLRRILQRKVKEMTTVRRADVKFLIDRAITVVTCPTEEELEELEHRAGVHH